jgi:uncharacterized protein (DUF362 family)
MKRRDFLIKGLGAGVFTGSALAMVNSNNVMGSPAPISEGENSFMGSGSTFNSLKPIDLVAVKGGEPEAMFDKAIEALGGMKQFVKPNQKVVIKPNIGWDATPERAANTNPKLIGRIVKRCFEAGAKEVVVFDNSCDEWTRSYKNSGIESEVKNAGGKMVTGKTETAYKEVNVPKGKNLTKAKVHEAIINADVFINVPVLKNHGGATVTISMKNLMGIVWDRGYWHKHDLHQCIADFASYRKPDLNVVDAYRVMKKNGPRGVSVEDVVTLKSLLISKDIVAIDAAATKIFGLNPDDIGYIKIAHEMGIGNKKLETLNIKKIDV